jgi:hypothetical protein
VCNLYLDDSRYSCLDAKALGRSRRGKYRVRFYNGCLDYIRLEHKAKDGLLTWKESARLTAEQYDMVRRGDLGFLARETGPLADSLRALHQTRRLRPAAEFVYTREAYTFAPGDVRLTFDSGVGADIPGLPPAGVLEVKYSSFLPRVVSDMLAGAPLVWTEFSKYCYVAEHKRRLTVYAG